LPEGPKGRNQNKKKQSDPPKIMGECDGLSTPPVKSKVDMQFSRNDILNENNWNRKLFQKRTLNVDRKSEDAVNWQQWRKESEIQQQM
jgi:hypothetical protein